jgi:hypothetical protein
VTTRHSASAYPWQTNATLPPAGVVLGLDQLSGGTVFSYDPWECYARGIISSPNMIVLGQLGRGKSALVKTYLSRQLLAGRQVYILDPKGEYAALAARHQLQHLKLGGGSAHRLNPLDPPPATADGPADSATTARSRISVLSALAEDGLRRPLTVEERACLAATVQHLAAGALLRDAVAALLNPDAHIAAELQNTPTQAAAAARPVALALQRLLTGDLAGMLDAPPTWLSVKLATAAAPDTDTHVDTGQADRAPANQADQASDGREHSPTSPSAGMVLDLSAVHGTDALAPVMVAAGAWLSARLATPSLQRRLLLVDEAWAVLGSPATTRWLQQLSKLARAHGVQLITVVHRTSDLTAQTDDGTASNRQAQGLLADAETRVIYAQAPGERATTRELLGLTDPEADLVGLLPPGRALWRVGNRTAVVDHLLGPADTYLVDTDQRMRP